MKLNLGRYDRILRILLGLGALIAGLVNSSWWGLLGIVPILTSFIGYCPLYVPLRLSTCPPSGRPATPPAASPGKGDH